MAGSLAHIVDDKDGRFRMDLIDNLRDAREALEEAHQFIAAVAMLCDGDVLVREILEDLAFPALETMPDLQPELHGAESKWRAP